MEERAVSDENVALLRRAVDAVNAGTLAEIAPEILTADFVRHDLAGAFPGVEGIDGASDFVSLLRRAMPDLRFEIADVFASGDRVALWVVMRGTHRGELLGAAPTGNVIEINEVNIYRIADGKIAETWQLPDYAGLLRQLGITSIPSAT